MRKKKRVVVAMSGGVDSSVAAALLKDEGYDVIGITMQIWPKSKRKDTSCCSLQAIEDARRVANRLGIPHYVVNLRKIFHEKVIDNFIQEYKKGKTPNPCIRCNKFVKFDALLHKTRELDADFISTGHYAMVEYDKKIKMWLLKRGVDVTKDQSYVLYPLLQGQLKHILLPLGNFTKSEVREIARKKGLLVADKKDSQEICFVPNDDYHRFLKTQIDTYIKPGLILDIQEKVIGEHKGLAFYTIGQRRGLGISAGRPLYVVDIDTKNNTIIVGPDEILYKDELIVEKVNFISIKKLSKSIRANVKIRYKHEASPAVIFSLGNRKVKVKFAHPQRAITPGQSAVFYDGDVVIGGGIIC